jgi:hypothetical protein
MGATPVEWRPLRRRASSNSGRAPGRARPVQGAFPPGSALTRSAEHAAQAAGERAASPGSRRAGSSSTRSSPRPRRGTRRTERCSATTPWLLRSRGASPAFCSSNRRSWSSSYHSTEENSVLDRAPRRFPELPPTRTPGWRAPGSGTLLFYLGAHNPGAPTRHYWM